MMEQGKDAFYEAARTESRLSLSLNYADLIPRSKNAFFLFLSPSQF